MDSDLKNDTNFFFKMICRELTAVGKIKINLQMNLILKEILKDIIRYLLLKNRRGFFFNVTIYDLDETGLMFFIYNQTRHCGFMGKKMFKC